MGFGNVLGQDKKMLKSRAGEAVKLDALLDEAVERAEAALATRQNEMVAADRSAVARDLGIGAVKYADLSTERQRDYVFDWERMLASEGNTGPYLQYAHARICSIFRRTGAAVPGPGTTVVLDHPHERALGLALLRFTGAIETSLVSYSPSKLCAYLFDLASVFTSFYENCPVLRAPDEATRDSRLLLSSLTARTLALGLSLLGIHSPQQM